MADTTKYVRPGLTPRWSPGRTAAVGALIGLAAILAMAFLAWPTSDPDPERPAGGGVTPVQLVQPADPTRVRIQALGIDEPLAGVGLAEDGTVEVPPVTDPQVVAWYAYGVRPGAPGPAVILGHVSGRPPGASKSVPGVFAHLGDLAAGDLIVVQRADDSSVTFAVRRVETYRKDEFPTRRVWGDTAGPELRLITCGGMFDPAAQSYDSNVVVYAEQV